MFDAFGPGHLRAIAAIFGEHDYDCPKCRGNMLQILEGEDMRLIRLETA
ncbi:hypothetical protein [Hydrogenimonas urashimensis]|nr:hypothetical protein [Hydrogenimonas urashimensis]